LGGGRWVGGRFKGLLTCITHLYMDTYVHLCDGSLYRRLFTVRSTNWGLRKKYDLNIPPSRAKSKKSANLTVYDVSTRRYTRYG
jgi:hypothetical protein